MPKFNSTIAALCGLLMFSASWFAPVTLAVAGTPTANVPASVPTPEVKHSPEALKALKEAAKSAEPAPVDTAFKRLNIPAPQFTTIKKYSKIDPSWHTLMKRMDADGLYNKDTERWFSTIPQCYSEKPMGSKISTLFRSRFMTTEEERQKTPPTPIYKSVLVQSTVERCAEFTRKNSKLLSRVEKRYSVPKEVIVALMMVETRLGEYMGSASPLWSLSCMAAADEPTRVKEYLDDLPVLEEHELWLKSTLKARSDWAYKELVALIEHSRRNRVNPLSIQGSIFGAIGLCQFMPSNIYKFGVDGNKDGKIDLFNLADAAHSAANYLSKHGWKRGITQPQKVAVLKRYNNSAAYANTILNLADEIAAHNNPEAAQKLATQKALKKANVPPLKLQSTSGQKKAAAATGKSAGSKVAPKPAGKATGKPAAKKPAGATSATSAGKK